MSEFKTLYKVDEELEFEDIHVNSSQVQVLGILRTEGTQLVEPKNLRYFRKPQPSSYPINLNIGYEQYEFRDNGYYEFHLKKLETYFMKYNGRNLLKNKNKQQICTSRGVFKDLMMTPYPMSYYSSKERNWIIKATKFGNVIYLTKDKENRGPGTPHESYHFKFQQHCFVDSPYKTPNINFGIDENIQTSCVFKMMLDNFELTYTAEIAGVESKDVIGDFKNPDVLNKCDFVLTKLLLDKSSNWKTHPKLLMWWIQAYLGRANKIYVGLKTKQGFINNQMECISTSDLSKHQKWNPEVCKRFLKGFLKKVEAVMSNVDCPYTTFEFKFDSAVKMIKYRVFEGKTDKSFLSESFIDYMQMN